MTLAVATQDVIHNEKLWEEILGYDLSTVTQTFAERHPEYADQAEILEIECKRFMYLAAVTPDDLAPTKPIDEYWHQFCLFTVEYTKFCEKFARAYVHHNPLAGPNHERIFEYTQQLVTQLFGANFQNVDLWFLPRPATSCRCSFTED